MKILFRLLRSLRPYSLQLVVLFFCVTGAGLAALVAPSLIQRAIDEGLDRKDPATLFSTGLLIVIVGLVRALFNLGRRYLAEWLTNRTGYDYRNSLYDKIQHLPFAYHDRTQTGQLMSRCTEDVSSLSRFIGSGVVELYNVFFLLGGIVVVLFRESAILALIGLGPLLLISFVTYRMGRSMSRLFYQVDQALGDLSATLQENLTGAPVVRAFAREAHEKEKFARSNRKEYDARVTVVSTWGTFFPTMPLLIMCSTALILWFGGGMAIQGTLSIGSLVAFNAYLMLLAGPVQQLGFVMNTAGEAVAGGRRIFEVLDQRLAVASPPDAIVLPPLAGRVTFESVSFSYRGDRDALHEISFEAKPNQVIALIGPTGSGKTSLVNLIPRFYEPTRGRIQVDGYDIRKVDLASLRSQIGIVLQTSLLFSATIRENIAYGRPAASEQEIIVAAKAARAHEFILSFPQGYATPVGERGITLSGGQRQRISIARALLMDPRILILDDSTSSVDTQTEYQIQQALAALMRDRTTFVIAQRLSTVKRADQILVLRDGRIAQRGRHDDLIAQGGPYREIYDLQLRDQEQFRQEMLFLEDAPELSPASAGNRPRVRAGRGEEG